MVVLLGGTGYLGRAFAGALRERGWSFRALSRREVNYTRFAVLLEYLQQTRPSFLINAAGYTGVPNVDACETARAETLAGNTILPQTIAHACLVAEVPWGHVSSGCIYSGAKLVVAGRIQVEKDLMRPEVLGLIRQNSSLIRGYMETDAPNFSFREPPCSFYSGSKALAEEAIAGVGLSYIWRLRIPFDEVDQRRNYLSKLQRYAKVYDNLNSLSHRRDCVRACLDLWERRAPFGVYNVTNPGFVSTRGVIATLQHRLAPHREFDFWKDDEEFYRLGAKAPRSNCVLDVSKLLATGVKLRPVDEALDEALRNWRVEEGVEENSREDTGVNSRLNVCG